MTEKPSRILFGSCNSQQRVQVLWPSILSRDPAAFVWGGDAIYSDQKNGIFSKRIEASPERLQRLYREQKHDPGYRKLLDKNIPIMGVLDDHDFGINNGDITYKYRTESGVAFGCEFLEHEGTASCDRAQNGFGVYSVKVMDFGRPDGTELLSDEEAGLDPDVAPQYNSTQQPLSNRSVAIFTLDMRSNKMPWDKKFPSSTFFDSVYEGDFLGETQWQWFEEALRRSTAAVNIVVQGIQVHAMRAGNAAVAENWRRFPAAQHRLYRALLQNGVKAPILVSGDVHHAQMLRRDCRIVAAGTDTTITASATNQTRTLLEVTTSGMTHSWGQGFCPRPSQSLLCSMPHIKIAAKVGMELGHLMNAPHSWTDLIYLDAAEISTEGQPGKQYTTQINFAEFDFDWKQHAVTIRIWGDQAGVPPLLSSTWTFDALSTKGVVGLHPELTEQPFLTAYNKLSEYGIPVDTSADGEWICLNYRGDPEYAHVVIGFILPTMVMMSMIFVPVLAPCILGCLFVRKRIRKSKLKLA